MRKYIFLCILYNKYCEESETILSFINTMTHRIDNKKSQDIDLWVWDNSINSDYLDNNSCFCQENNIGYVGHGKNEKLGTIYNRFILDNKDNYLLIFDDDSTVSQEYVDQVLGVTQHKEIYVGIPKVYSKLGSLYSPAKFGLVKGKHFNDIKSGYHSGLVAIASGMVINCSKILERGVSFDEYLSLYGIDTDFFLTTQRENIQIYVFDVNLKHDLSFYNEEHKSIKKKRLLNFLKSNLYISKKRGLRYYILFLLYSIFVLAKNVRLFCP